MDGIERCGRTGAPAIIAGDFTDSQARLLAAQVGHGPLPVRLEIQSYQP